MSKQSLVTSENLIHAISGTLGGVFSITLLFPFETARTRLQVDDRRPSKLSVKVIRDLIYEEGWRSLYQGWRSLLVSLSVTNFVYFYVFYGLRSFNWSLSTDDHSFLENENHVQNIFTDLMNGTIAGIVAVIISNPFWVINTRLKLQGVKLEASGRHAEKHSKYHGIADCFVEIIKTESPVALYSGLLSSLVLVSNPAINFMIYESLKRNILPVLRSFISESSLYFCFGGTSKLVATVVTYPIQVVQTRARAGIGEKSNLAAIKIRRPNIGFWFRGLESKLVQTVLMSAIMLLTYEHIRSLALLLLGFI